jgi:hypothetical protein
MGGGAKHHDLIPKIIINLDSDSDTDSERDHDREGETTDMYWSE